MDLRADGVDGVAGATAAGDCAGRSSNTIAFFANAICGFVKPLTESLPAASAVKTKRQLHVWIGERCVYTRSVEMKKKPSMNKIRRRN
jgi:hypothetical protein